VLEVATRRREERKRVEGGNRRRDTVYVSGRGSSHKKDEKERRQRQKEQGEPVIVYAGPGWDGTYHRLGLAFLGYGIFISWFISFLNLSTINFRY
jgi:hypothetical protein